MNNKEKSKQFRILLVEENEQHIQQALNAHGIDTDLTHCKDANDALKQVQDNLFFPSSGDNPLFPESDLRTSLFDVIIVSHKLPEISGLDFCRKLTEQKIFIPLILLIESGEEEIAVKALRAGVATYLIKDEKQLYLELLSIIIPEVIQRKKDRLAREQAEKALHETEVKYHSMMEAMQDPLYICSSDFRIVFMNPAMVQRTGRNATGELCHKALHDLDERCSWCLFEKIRRGESYKLEIYSPKNERFYHISNSPIFHSDGSVSKMTIYRDITDQKQNEADLKKAKKAAESASQAKTHFLANMSHEIRTPMNSVMGMIDLTLKTRLDAQQQDYLETAKASADSLLELINDILDMSKIETDQIKLEETDVDLYKLLENIVKAFSIRANHKNLALNFNLDKNIAPVIKTDARRLRQILSNLLSNAVKFTEKGDIMLTADQEYCDEQNISSRSQTGVSPSRSQAPSRERDEFYIHFAVTDTGIGIPPEQSEQIFDSFTQADSSMTRRFGGTGMGTTISKHLTELMGGRIWLESKVGEGSTFHFTIKVKPGKIVQSPANEIPHILQPPKRKLKILLAEDNLLNQKLALILLKQRGHETVIVSDGKSAVEAFEQEHFDVILMDVQMPEMDGLEATRIIREKENKTKSHIPIIALTAHAMDGDDKQCLSAGMDAYVSKPIQGDKILETIEKLVHESDDKASDSKASDSKAVRDSEKQVFSEDVIMTIVGGNAELVKELIRLYFDNLPDHMTQIQDAIHENNAEKLQFKSHSLKGMSLNLSGQRVADRALELEIIGRSGDLSRAEEVYAQLKEEVERLKTAIARFQEMKDKN